MPTFALNFSRPGGQVVCQYYLLLRLGRDGYRRVHRRTATKPRNLARAIRRSGPFEILFDGDARHGIPALSWKLEGQGQGGLFVVRSRTGCACAAGRRQPTMVPNIADVTVMRLLIRHGFSRDLVLFLDDLKARARFLQQMPGNTNADPAKTRGSVTTRFRLKSWHDGK